MISSFRYVGNDVAHDTRVPYSPSGLPDRVKNGFGFHPCLGHMPQRQGLVESVDEREVTEAEGQVMEVEEAERGRAQEAWGQDRGPDLAYDNIAP
jgi:hypothetical protein